MTTRKATVIGDGAWGTALALDLLSNDHRVTLWGPFKDYIDTMRRDRENTRYLPGISLPATLDLTTDAAEAVAGTDLVVVAAPSRYVRDVVAHFSGNVPAACPIVSVVKGLDATTGERMTQLIANILGSRRLAALSGPSHAEEVARGLPTAVVIAAEDSALADDLAAAFSTPRFRAYTSSDVIGTELGGALKNVVAIAAGVCDGIGFGDNTKAALITRGLAEISRLGSALGARRETFAGLSGMGDLIVTCMSRWSRNRGVGERLGKGESPEAVLSEALHAVEGAWTCATARQLAHEQGVDMPITEQVYSVLHEGRDARAAVEALMGRKTRSEEE